MRNIAIILAGGTGSRVGGNKPKQLLPLQDGRTILEHSVDAFEQAPDIDEVAIVMHPDWLSEAEQLRSRNSWEKVTRVIPGGKERWESSVHAIEAYKEEQDGALLLHDAARPFVSQQIIADVCRALRTHAAVTVAVPVTDTLYQVNEDTVKQIPNRADFMRAQTPQAFHLNILREAFRRALSEGQMIVTDDAGVVHRYMPEQPIYIVPGDEDNKKITYERDL